ncbi:hypothetical protein Hanom_Chr07g00615381 [Helianthus anomalus]
MKVVAHISSLQSMSMKAHTLVHQNMSMREEVHTFGLHRMCMKLMARTWAPHSRCMNWMVDMSYYIEPSVRYDN